MGWSLGLVVQVTATTRLRKAACWTYVDCALRANTNRYVTHQIMICVSNLARSMHRKGLRLLIASSRLGGVANNMLRNYAPSVF